MGKDETVKKQQVIALAGCWKPKNGDEAFILHSRTLAETAEKINMADDFSMEEKKLLDVYDEYQEGVNSLKAYILKGTAYVHRGILYADVSFYPDADTSKEIVPKVEVENGVVKRILSFGLCKETLKPESTLAGIENKYERAVKELLTWKEGSKREVDNMMKCVEKAKKDNPVLAKMLEALDNQIRILTNLAFHQGYSRAITEVEQSLEE